MTRTTRHPAQFVFGFLLALLLARPALGQVASADAVAADRAGAGGSSGDGTKAVPEELRPFFAAEKPQGQLRPTALQAGKAAAVALAVSADNSTLVTCDAGGVCRTFDLKSRQEVSRFEQDLEGKAFCLALTRDGRHAAVGGEFEAVHVWDTQTGKLVMTHDAPKSAVVAVSLSDDATWMVALAEDGAVFRFPMRGGLGNGFAALPPGADAGYGTFAVTPDGQHAIGTRFEDFSVLYRFPKPVLIPAPGLILQSVAPVKDLPFAALAAAATDEFYGLVGEHGRYLVMSTDAAWTRGRLRWLSGRGTIPQARALTVTPDNRLVVAVNLAGSVEALAVPTMRPALRLRLNFGPATAAAVSRDGRLVAFGFASGRLIACELPTIPDPPEAVFRAAVLQARLKKDYPLLERLAAWLGSGPEPFDWSQGVPRYEMLVDALSTEPAPWADGPAAAEALKGWLEEEPESVLARLGLSQHHLEGAWQARGGGFADTVSEEGWQIFGEQAAEAEELLEPIQPDEKTPPEYYRQMLALARMRGWDRDRFDELTGQVLKFAPDYTPAHQQAAEYLLPRWHGEPGELAAYLDRVCNHIARHTDKTNNAATSTARGDRLYAQVAVRLGQYGTPGLDDRQQFALFEVDLGRVRRGMEHHRMARPDDPLAVVELFYIAWLQEDRAAAKTYLARLKAVWGELPPDFWQKRAVFNDIVAWAEQAAAPAGAAPDGTKAQ